MGFFATTATADSQQRFALIDIAFPSGTLYLTDRDVPITYGGHTYLPASITTGGVRGSEGQEEASFAIADADEVFFALLAGTNGGDGVRVNIYAAGFLSTNFTAVADEVGKIFGGAIDVSRNSTHGDADSVDITCGPYADPASVDIPNRTIASLVRLVP